MLKLVYCSMTGADDNSDPVKLLDLQKKYPFVEWAFLVSKTSEGKEKYPTRKWLMDLHKYRYKKIAFHICGSSMEQFVTNPNNINMPVPNFENPRFQINFNNTQRNFTPEQIVAAGKVPFVKPVIFQYNKANQKLMFDIMMKYPRFSMQLLHDSSGGRGVAAREWKDPVSGYLNGYAGGLGPDNIETELPKIKDKVKVGRFWIDMESKIRTDGKFDLEKVEFVLAKVKEIMNVA